MDDLQSHSAETKALGQVLKGGAYGLGAYWIFDLIREFDWEAIVWMLGGGTIYFLIAYKLHAPRGESTYVYAKRLAYELYRQAETHWWRMREHIFSKKNEPADH